MSDADTKAEVKEEKKVAPFSLYPYEWNYERLYPPRRWWTPSVLFDRWRWRANLSPGYPDTLKRIFNNVCAFLTPWARNQRLLVLNFENANDTKLLADSPCFAYVRTRGFGEQIDYYLLKVNPITFRATLYRERTIEQATGNSVVTYGVFIKSLLSGKPPAEGDYITTREKVVSGWALTRRQCQRLFNRIVETTPNCYWSDPARLFA